MSGHLSHPRLTAWLAIWAFMLGALAPAMTQWMTASAQTSGMWAEVCTTNGARWVAVGKGTSQDEPGHQASEHCPLCVIQAHAVGLPPPSLANIVLITQGADALPWLFLRAPHTLFAWSPALARAPPAQA